MQPNFMTDYKRLAAYNALLLDQNKELAERCERLEMALRDVRSMFTSQNWGDYNYMEGVGIYEDASGIVKTIDDLLQEATGAAT